LTPHCCMSYDTADEMDRCPFVVLLEISRCAAH
jgi:hypothetical protein